MPARLVYQDEGMSPGRNRLRDLVQVQGHPLGRAARQHQASALAVSRADRAEDVGRRCPLVFRSGRARAALGPAPRDLVLLPDPRLIGEPDLERLAADRLPDRLQTGREVFLKAATAASFFA